MQGGTGRRELGEAALDRRMNVFIGVAEFELAVIQLPLDAAKPAFDGGESGTGQKARLGQPAGVGDAPGDVKRVELEIGLERRGESFQLRVKALLKAPAPQFAPSPTRGRGLMGVGQLAPSPVRGRAGVGGGTSFVPYGVSLFTSPSRLPSSRACSWPWTRAEVRTPMPHNLMKPAAADWSNSSPFP